MDDARAREGRDLVEDAVFGEELLHGVEHDPSGVYSLVGNT